MLDPDEIAEIHARLSASGMASADLRWLESIGYDDASIPEVGSEEDAEAYRRREQHLNRAVADLLLPERVIRPESKIAAAIGARLADWADRDEED